MHKQIITASLAVFFAAGGPVSAQPQSDTPLWVYDAGQVIQGSPALATDGTVYIGVGNALFAITNADSVASNKWIFASGLSTVGAPAVGSDGTVYISGGKLCAVNPDGSEKWSYPGIGNGCPAVGRDSTLYSQGASRLYAVSPSGELKWGGAAGGDYFFSSAALGPQGDIYVNSPNVHVFFALNPDGTEKWHAGIGIFNPADSAAIGGDGGIYFSAGQLYAFSPIGSNVWSAFAEGSPASPVIGVDGTIYVAGNTAMYPFGYGLGLYAIAPTGVLRWQFTTNNLGPPRMLNTPAIDSAGVLYCTAYSRLFAVSADGNLRWAFNPGDASESFTSPTIGPDGTIYATFGSKLYAFAGTNKLADSPWPMYRQNARHTGKVEKPALKNPQRRSDANFQFQLYAQLGQTNTVESTTDLINWSWLTNVVVSSVPMEVVDHSASNFPALFYRAVSP